MKTVVSAYGPFVMNVFEPLRRYSSPSRRAVDCMLPNASEPELGSVIAHAPILSSVSRSRAQRSFCSIVPLLMIDAAVSPTLTPIAVTIPGEHRHSSMIGMVNMAPCPLDSLAAGGDTPPAGARSSARLCSLPLAPPASCCARSASMRFLKLSRARASRPNVR